MVKNYVLLTLILIIRAKTYVVCERVIDANINVIGQRHMLCVKELFLKIIQYVNWNSSAQQDASEGLSEILNNQQRNNNISNVPFGFCAYKWRWRKTCNSCHNEFNSQDNTVNVLYIHKPQREGDYYTYDMREAVKTTLGPEHDLHITCPKCQQKGAI